VSGVAGAEIPGLRGWNHLHGLCSPHVEWEDRWLLLEGGGANLV